jgi:hypothetical protein
LKLTLLFLLLASVSVQGQIVRDTAMWQNAKTATQMRAQTKGKVSGKIDLSSSSSGPVYIGFNEGKTSVMMNLADSTFRIAGKDTLAVIKMMWIKIHENSKMYEKQILWLHKHIDKEEKLIKDLMQYAKDRDRIDQELRDNLKKVMGKKQ